MKSKQRIYHVWCIACVLTLGVSQYRSYWKSVPVVVLLPTYILLWCITSDIYTQTVVWKYYLKP